MLHCTAGKDRTGVLCALILSLCGCSDVTTAREYELTEQGLAHWREGAAEALKKSHRLDFNHETALNMLSARFESMLATLEMIREKFGGTEKYLIDVVGLTKKEIKQIRDNLVVDEPAIHEMEK